MFVIYMPTLMYAKHTTLDYCLENHHTIPKLKLKFKNKTFGIPKF